MTMLSFIVAGLALLLALVSIVFLARPAQPDGHDNSPSSAAGRLDHSVQVP